MPDNHKAPSETELAVLGAPHWVTECISGWRTKIWIRISETPLTKLDIAGMRSNGFVFAFHVRTFTSLATKLSGTALQKYDCNRKLHFQAFLFFNLYEPSVSEERPISVSVYLDALQLWLFPQMEESEPYNFIWH
ncbi:hypothetical protein TNCV_520801 [Trichonephila clavipes]|nr:hypothetical protein TNCV_520801 [Trichonephila clavipes]